MILPSGVEVWQGPSLLAGLSDGPSYEAHAADGRHLPKLTARQLVDLTTQAQVRGRGGAGFPLGRKIQTVARTRGRAVVVVNASEGEPASHKDTALLQVAPHRVLDGAVVAARALGARTIHVVTPAERPEAGAAVHAAIAERPKERVRWMQHEADPGFVSGQARAVLELMAGRPNLPVTAWAPEAMSGHNGRPTLLSNAETFAHLGVLTRGGVQAYADLGTEAEPGTTLLSVGGSLPDGPTGSPRTRVVEVEHGTPLVQVLPTGALQCPILTGGYHGTWADPGVGESLLVSRTSFADHGLALGAGVIIPLLDGSCPVRRTAAVTRYLAGETAGRCGPCFNGLPALADAVEDLARGYDTSVTVDRLRRLVTGRGACAHPDGTARLVGSLIANIAPVVTSHLAGLCACPDQQRAA